MKHSLIHCKTWTEAFTHNFSLVLYVFVYIFSFFSLSFAHTLHFYIAHGCGDRLYVIMKCQHIIVIVLMD